MTDTRPTHDQPQVTYPGQTHTARGPIDLRNMYLAHHAFRRDLRAFEAAVRQTPTGEAKVWRLLEARWSLFAEILHHHHTIEDETIWPVLVTGTSAAGDTDGVEVLNAMEAEHDLIDPVLEACTAGFRAMVEHPCADHRNALDVHVTSAHQLLADHLRHEETQALPLLQTHMTAEAWKASEEFADKGITLRLIANGAPWCLAGLSAEQREAQLRAWDAVTRVLVRVFESRYQRRERVAFRYA